MFMTRRHLAEIRPRAKHDLRTHGSWFLSDFRRTKSKFFRWFFGALLFSTACCTHQAAAHMNCRPPQAKQSKLQHLAMLPKANDTAVQSTAKGGAKKNRKFYRRRNCSVGTRNVTSNAFGSWDARKYLNFHVRSGAWITHTPNAIPCIKQDLYYRSQLHI